MLRDGEELVIAAGAGHVTISDGARRAARRVHRRRGARMPAALGASRDAARELRISPERLGVGHATTALLVPLLYRGQGLGVLAAFDRLDGDGAFTRDDERLLEAFAAQRGDGGGDGQIGGGRPPAPVAGGGRGRAPALGARAARRDAAGARGPARAALERRAARRSGRHARGHARGRRAADGRYRIAALADRRAAPRRRSTSSGWRRRSTSLAQRTGAGGELEVRTDVELPTDRRLTPEVETTVYRVVQESLTNVVKHARAASVDLAVRCDGGAIEISVADDGIGFDPDGSAATGFGVIGMRERVELAGGELSVLRGPDAGDRRPRAAAARAEPRYSAPTKPWSSA